MRQDFKKKKSVKVHKEERKIQFSHLSGNLEGANRSGEEIFKYTIFTTENRQII